MNEKRQKLEEKIKTISIAVSLLVTIGGVVIGIFNYLTLNQLTPLSTRIDQIEANQQRLETTLATKDQVVGLITRVDKISSRVDQILNVLMR